MNISEQVINSGLSHVLDGKKKNTCVMLDDSGKEVQITKDMVVSVCHQLLNKCRNVKN
ncbi:PA1571 family protein [Acinetobacter sp. ANC 3832]|uniref:PA1571 family protein n=1 Tax=Acinetobacter sp. ANC 3832 TaxID=1977874 RepID=UPI00148A2DA6|nr:PA1571 family protein [Acinetobacter sp. ANC 3832]